MLRRATRALSSLRWRLTLSFVALLALILAGLGTYNYLTLRSTLISNRVSSLESDYTTARAVIARLADLEALIEAWNAAG